MFTDTLVFKEGYYLSVKQKTIFQQSKIEQKPRSQKALFCSLNRFTIFQRNISVNEQMQGCFYRADFPGIHFEYHRIDFQFLELRRGFLDCGGPVGV